MIVSYRKYKKTQLQVYINEKTSLKKTQSRYILKEQLKSLLEACLQELVCTLELMQHQSDPLEPVLNWH